MHEEDESVLLEMLKQRAENNRRLLKLHLTQAQIERHNTLLERWDKGLDLQKFDIVIIPESEAFEVSFTYENNNGRNCKIIIQPNGSSSM